MWTSPRQLALLGLAAAGQVHATPVNGISQLECLAVELVVLALDACATATPFCSSYLSIPTVTKTATVTTSSTTTLTTSTTTGTNTITVSTVTQTQTAAATVTTCILSADDDSSYDYYDYYKKRDVEARGGAAVAIPAALSKFARAQISTACSCLGIPTPSTTVTMTATATKLVTSIINLAATTDVTATSVITVTTTTTDTVCPTPTQCNNQGFQFALYPNTQGDNDDSTYSQFDPAIYKTETPEFSSVTSTAGGIDYSGGQEITIYGTSYEFESDYFVLDHRGYLFAAVDGTYTVTVSDVDDAAFLWVGADAYEGWTRANANAVIITANSGGVGKGSASVAMVEGEYLPIRIMFVQAQGDAAFEVSITAPDGTVFLSSSTESSPYLVQYSCDEVAAPEFPAWGSEI